MINNQIHCTDIAAFFIQEVKNRKKKENQNGIPNTT